MDKATEYLQQLVQDKKDEKPTRQFQDALYRTPVSSTQGPTADTLLAEYRREQDTPRKVTDQDAAAEELADLVRREL